MTQEPRTTPTASGRSGRRGLGRLGVSLDGLQPLHDKLRGVPGSFHQALDTLRQARLAGLNISVNTQIGAEVIPQLPELMDVIIGAGAKQWQIRDHCRDG